RNLRCDRHSGPKAWRRSTVVSSRYLHPSRRWAVRFYAEPRAQNEKFAVRRSSPRLATSQKFMGTSPLYVTPQNIEPSHLYANASHTAPAARGFPISATSPSGTTYG